MTRFPLRRLRLRAGEEHREPVQIELEPFDLGGQRYLTVPQEIDADLTVVQATGGLDLRLAFDVRLHGPCMRCLADAALDIHVDAREYHAPTGVRRRSFAASTSSTTSSSSRPGRATRSLWRCPTRSCTRPTAPASAPSAART